MRKDEKPIIDTLEIEADSVIQNLVHETAATVQTQEMRIGGVSTQFLELAIHSLKQPATLSETNRAYRNWNTEKMPEINRACFLFVGKMPVINEKTNDVEERDCAYFMDSNFNLFYKVAYQFVKAVEGFPMFTNFYAKFECREKIASGNLAEKFIVRTWDLDKVAA